MAENKKVNFFVVGGMTDKMRKLIGESIINLHPLMKDVDSRVKRKLVLNRLAISHKSKYGFFRIPKCANSTIVKNLVYYDPNLDYYDVDDSNEKPVSEQFKKKFDNTSLRTLLMLRFPKDYYLFTFVRNPYSRVLSAYLDKIVNRTNEKSYDPVRKFIRNVSKNNELNFEGFIEYLENKGLYQNPHWLPQTSMLPVKKEKLNFIGKVENINNDLPKLIDNIFGANTFKEEKQKNSGRTGAVNLIEKYYTKELAKRVYNLYRKDFEAFNYSKELPKKK